jgi:hypothetical protein
VFRNVSRQTQCPWFSVMVLFPRFCHHFIVISGIFHVSYTFLIRQRFVFRCASVAGVFKNSQTWCFIPLGEEKASKWKKQASHQEAKIAAMS